MVVPFWLVKFSGQNSAKNQNRLSVRPPKLRAASPREMPEPGKRWGPNGERGESQKSPRNTMENDENVYQNPLKMVKLMMFKLSPIFLFMGGMERSKIA
jgi:hypothetical protein